MTEPEQFFLEMNLNISFEEPKEFILYTSPVVLFFSTIGNVLTMITLSKLCYEVWSSTIYLAIMSVLDLFIVFTRCGNVWLLTITDWDLTGELLLSSMSVCKVYVFMSSFIFHMEKWLMVCLTVDLYLVIRYPSKVSEWCTLSRAKATILLLTVIMACINLHFFWTYEIVNTAELDMGYQMDVYMCTWVKQGVSHSELFQEAIWPTLEISVAQILPLITISTFTILNFIECVCGKGLSDKNEEEWRKKYLIYPDALRQMKMAVLILSVLYILTVPRPSNFILEKFNLGTADELALNIFEHLEYTFLSLKFYILYICCSQFRAQCFKICERLCPFRNKCDQYANDSNSSDYSTLENPARRSRVYLNICSTCCVKPHMVPSHPSSRALMTSNLSSIEFHMEADTQCNHNNTSLTVQKSLVKQTDNTTV